MEWQITQLPDDAAADDGTLKAFNPAEDMSGSPGAASALSPLNVLKFCAQS